MSFKASIISQKHLNIEKFKNQDEKCYICNDEIELFKEDIAVAPCKHIFHIKSFKVYIINYLILTTASEIFCFVDGFL